MNVGSQGYKCLRESIEKGHVSVTKILLSTASVSPRAVPSHSVRGVVKRGDLNMLRYASLRSSDVDLRLLINFKCVNPLDVDKKGRNLVHLSASYNVAHCFSTLIGLGISIDSVDDKGTSYRVTQF